MVSGVKGLEIKTQITAPILDVFAALIEPRLLNMWFADNTIIEPRQKGTLSFCGPHAFPGGEKVEGRIVTFSPPERLDYVWPMQQGETRVNILLNKLNEDETIILVAHDSLSLDMDPFLLERAWMVNISNLRLLLETNKPGLRYDYRQSPNRTCIVKNKINSTAAAVFDSFINPDKLEQWIASSARVDPTIGGLYNWGWANSGPVNIAKLKPPGKLVFNWHDGHHKSLVMVETKENKKYARAKITHLDITPKSQIHYHLGWTAYLNLLKLFLETGRAETYRTHI